MPRRRRDPTAEILEDLADAAVDSLFDRAGKAWQNFRSQQQQALPEGAVRQQFKCAACHNHFALAEIEMVHPSNGFALCKPCFKFLWEAGTEKLKGFAQRAARQQQARPAPGPGPGAHRSAPEPPPPGGKPPWEILGCAEHASLEEVKKAYRRQAMLWHPDRVPPTASADEQLRAKAMFAEVQRAYKVMVSVRSAPEG